MNPAEMLSHRLAPEAAARAFVLSGKRHLILTGGRGSGKSTLFQGLLPMSGAAVPVLGTFARPGQGVFLQSEGGSVPIGRYDATLPGTENKMRPVPEGMARFRQRLLELGGSDSDWAAIDELGYLEAGCEAVQRAVETLMERKRLLAVVRKQQLPFLERLCRHPDGYRIDLDRPFPALGCVVMASGLGKRFGGNKLLAGLGGRPVLGWVLEGTEGLFVRRVVVTRHLPVEDFCRQRRVEVLRHDLPRRSDTVRLGLEALGPELDGYVFFPGDQPMVRRETLQALALAAAREPEYIWRLARPGGPPGSPVLFPRWAYEELRSLPEGQGGRAVIRRHPEQVRLLPVRDFELLDIDTPMDLSFLEEKLDKEL